jgi:hypothetical protein
MITKDITDIQKYAKVSSTFTYALLSPELSDVADNQLAQAISLEEYAILDAYTGADVILIQAIEFIKKAEINLALFNYMAVGGLQITKGGISVLTPQNQEPAEKVDKRDALRLYKKKGYKAIDNVLALFDKNEDKFAAWKASEQYTKFKSVLVNNTAEFQEHYNIFNSRQTFIHLVPELKIVEQQYLIPGLTLATLKELKTSTSVDPIFTEVKNLVSKAAVLYTVSKNLGSGLFYQSSNGFELRFDILDYERNFTNAKEISTHLIKQRKEKKNEAKEFLKTALKTIKENPILFSYTELTVTRATPFINGKGVVAI